MVKDGRGGKLHDAGKVLVLQVVGGVQAAAGQKGVLDTGSQEVPKAHFQIEVVQFFQQTVLHIISQIVQMLPVNLLHRTAGLLHELIAKVRFFRGTVLLLQRLRNSGVVFRPHFPQVGGPRPLDRAGICHIKDVFQLRPAASIFPNEGDTFGAGLHPASHGIIPQLHAGAGGSVRALGVDQELFVKGIFIEPGGGGQIPFPAVYVPRDSMGGLVCQLRYKLQFTCHENLLFSV